VRSNDLHVLCYQHHKEMVPRVPIEIAEELLFACREPGCLVRYDSSRGYFIETEDGKPIEHEPMPRVSCHKDEHLMYLAAVLPERKSFRLWKCPECDAIRINEEASQGLGKKMRA